MKLPSTLTMISKGMGMFQKRQSTSVGESIRDDFILTRERTECKKASKKTGRNCKLNLIL